MPPLKPCIVCGTPSPKARCIEHRAKASTKARGLSGEHAAISRKFKALGLLCAICGRPGSSNNPITAGHIKARVLGGSNDISNYQPECRSCNSRKGVN